jgi:RNA polymerase sigma-54 factor
MAQGLGLQQKQSQSLVMTPKLAQSIKLLQMGHFDLMDYVISEIEKNPLLELDTEQSGSHSDKRSDRDGSSEVSKDTPSTQDASEQVSTEMKVDAASTADDIDTNFDNVYDGGTAGAEQQGATQTSSSSKDKGSSSSSSNNENLDLIAQLGESQSLAQHLDFQISVSFKDATRRRIAQYIAHALDNDGYFREDPKQTADHLNVGLDGFLSVLEKFQTLEPAGVGARNLAECLAIQLKDQNRLDPAMEIFIANLDMLARRELEALKKLCGVSTEDFNDMIREIKTLDPRPALKFEPILSQTVVPDVLVSQKADGSWAIDLNPETLPSVLVDRDYHAELEKVVDSDEGKLFISECMSNANWLTRSLDQRAQTILKVSMEILKQQDMFFAKGVEHLKPMNLKTVAAAIKMHESTVSRVTSDKYLLCDQGTFELKYFFSSAINGQDGEGTHSAETVKHHIKKLVDCEDPKKILSDDKIVQLLQETGIEIARRTVAKYREALRIPSSVQRRREKSMAIQQSA